MLKIKDNIDLKELEKFGFMYNSFDKYYYNDEYVIKEDKIIRKIICCDHEYEYEDLYFEPLYDLIKANLVEKVDE